MANLKKEQKKLLTREITSKIMEYLIGLNEKKEPAIQKIAKRSSSRVVSAYYDAIKCQHKKLMRATVKEEEPAQVIYEETTDLIAS
jgi:hypothetical protein